MPFRSFFNSLLVSRRAIVSAIPFAALALPATTAASPAALSDPIFAQIERHKALLILANTISERDPAYQAAQDDEEAAIQALGDMRPTSIAAAAAQLSYMAEVEGDFANNGSPLLQTVLAVAEGLALINGGSA